MRRLWAASAAIVTCLALGVVPALAREGAAADLAPFHVVAEGSEVVWGTASCSISLSEGDKTEGAEGWLVRCALDMSDPRVSGTETQDRFHVLAGMLFAGDVWVAEEAKIANNEGTWYGSAQGAEDDQTLLAGEGHYVGEGAYEGLEFHYYFSAEHDTSQGVYHGWISPLSEPSTE